MRYDRNAIYTKVKNAIVSEYPSIHTSSRALEVPKSFPYVLIHEIEHYDAQEGLTLDLDNDYCESTFEVQIYTTGEDRQVSAYAILDRIKSTLRTLFYIEQSENEIQNIDISVYRLVARFRRKYGSGDTIPQ